MSARRSPEPWPLAVVGMLLAMVLSCVAFYRIAVTHPDPVVVPDAQAAEAAFNAAAERAAAERRALQRAETGS